MSATPEQIGKRLLWATASHVADREVLESAAAAFSLTVRYCSPNELASFLRPGGDHLVGIELTDDPAVSLTIIRELHVRMPTVSVIAASENADVDFMRAALHAGASDFLTLPLSAHELHKALLRVAQVAQRAASRRPAGQVITVYGARGGLGATTLAVSLAFKLASVTKSETALVDLDLQRGDVATFVNLVPVHSLATIASAPGEVDEIFLASALTRHPSGVSILTAPPKIEEADLVTDREVEIALRLMRSQFAFTVVDTPRVITAPVAAAFEDSDRILVLTDLSVPSVRAAHRAFELLGRLEIPPDRAQLVITQVVDGPVEVKKAEQVMGREAFAVIPRDDAAGTAMNDGVPLNGRPTRLSAAIDELARSLAGVGSTSKVRRSFLKRIFPKGARP